ncbi:MAG: hypothetical protein KKF79_01820 [Gammaproteobacteria bacterium]|nr:hypothetical protein [Gammaproteobacteria bacterium]
MKSKFRLKNGLLSILFACNLFNVAQAQQPISVNGFGSVRMGKLIPSKDNPKLVEFYNDDGLSFADDTLFGLQLQAESDNDLSYTLQLIGKAVADYKPEVSLAFVKYQLNPNHKIKFGRLAVPLFAQSDVQYIGYAHDYSRLPKAVYYRFDFEVADGVAFEGQQIYQDFSLNYLLQLTDFKGQVFKNQLPGGIELKLHQMKNFRLELNYQNLQLFTGGIRAKTDGSQLNEVLINSRVLPAVLASGASAIEQQNFLSGLNFNKNAQYTFVGFRWQQQAWKLEGEHARYGINDSADAASTSEYLALSYRFDPYILSLHHERATENPHNLAVLRQTTDPVLRQIGARFAQALNNVDYRMQVLSLRYDLQPGLCLKADLFRGHHRLENIGTFKGFSLGVDFVF